LELGYGQTPPGRVQHRLPGGPPNAPPAGPPHDFGGVLPLLLLSPCQPLLLPQRCDGEVRNEEEK